MTPGRALAEATRRMLAMLAQEERAIPWPAAMQFARDGVMPVLLEKLPTRSDVAGRWRQFERAWMACPEAQTVYCRMLADSANEGRLL